MIGRECQACARLENEANAVDGGAGHGGGGDGEGAARMARSLASPRSTAYARVRARTKVTGIGPITVSVS